MRLGKIAKSSSHTASTIDSVSTRDPRARLNGIWVDLDNSPHIPFFVPIIEQLEQRGYTVTVTARDCFQVVDLARLHHLRHRTVGRHYGKSRILKIAGLCVRTLQLISELGSERPHLAVSHGSRAQLAACWLLRIPSVVIIDYEFARGLQVIHPTWVMCPEIVAQSEDSCRNKRLITYPGIKEDVYVPRFTPDPSIMRDLGLTSNDIVITLRPPATEAHYHNPESEILLSTIFEMLAGVPEAKVIVLPRNQRQETALRRTWPKLFQTEKVLVPPAVVDGLNLIWHSDLVISGGGTMNREAAALGVPVYSIFRGHIGAVDRYLADTGRLVLLESVDDVRSKLVLARRNRSARTEIEAKGTLSKIVDHVVNILEMGTPQTTRAQ